MDWLTSLERFGQSGIPRVNFGELIDRVGEDEGVVLLARVAPGRAVEGVPEDLHRFREYRTGANECQSELVDARKPTCYNRCKFYRLPNGDLRDANKMKIESRPSVKVHWFRGLARTAEPFC